MPRYSMINNQYTSSKCTKPYEALVHKYCESTWGRIEKLQAAYLKETNLKATEAELVQHMNTNGDIVWYFRPRTTNKGIIVE